jgi:hypothetical protein
MRKLASFPLLLALIGGSSHAQEATIKGTSDCLAREVKAVAPKHMDLDTAAATVLANCDYPRVIEKMLAGLPVPRDFVEKEGRRRYVEVLQRVRELIAKLRAQ